MFRFFVTAILFVCHSCNLLLPPVRCTIKYYYDLWCVSLCNEKRNEVWIITWTSFIRNAKRTIIPSMLFSVPRNTEILSLCHRVERLKKHDVRAHGHDSGLHSSKHSTNKIWSYFLHVRNFDVSLRCCKVRGRSRFKNSLYAERSAQLCPTLTFCNLGAQTVVPPCIINMTTKRSTSVKDLRRQLFFKCFSLFGEASRTSL
jgi:hypothetical protein